MRSSGTKNHDCHLRFAGSKRSNHEEIATVSGRPDIQRDAELAFAVLERGGIAILPMSVGYSAIGGSAAALKTIFETKRRKPSKLNAMLGDMALHRELHVLDQRGWDVASTLIDDFDLPLGAIAPARMNHPILQAMEPEALEASTSDGTVLMLLNAGPFHAAITRLSREALHPLFGSSANRSLSGTKFRVEDIEPEVMGIADIVIDHGLRLYHLYRASSTLLDLETFEVVRYGACFELIADAMKRRFGFELPPPPPGHIRDLIGDLPSDHHLQRRRRDATITYGNDTLDSILVEDVGNDGLAAGDFDFL